MNIQELKEQMYKNLHPSVNIDYYMEVINSLPKNEWFVPSAKDSDGNNFAICDHLHHHHLIGQKREPVWVNGSLRGVRISFKIDS